MTPALESIDAKNKLEDLSGVQLQPGENPYKALIKACNNDAATIQSLYSTHRVTRNAQQKEKFLASDFKEVLIDPILLRLENPKIEPGFSDPRNCLVLWARPPDHIIKLATHLQERLRKAAPNLWLMPPHRMHLTTLEVNHSRTPAEITQLVEQLRPSLPALTNFTHTHRARLVRPLISYDLAALAVSFLPAGGDDDNYTYHHLRSDVFELARSSSAVDIASRYVVPSAHITLGRYLTQDDHATPAAREAWVRAIDEVNAWLQREVWDVSLDGDEESAAGFVGEWIVGQEKGLDARAGTLWYGGGRTVMMGEGF